MIKFLKIRDVKSPQRKEGDAGIDFFIPNDSPEFVKAFLALNVGKPIALSERLIPTKDKDGVVVVKEVIIPPLESINIPSGVKCRIDKDYVLYLANKSGVCEGQKLHVGACVVDASYEGEIILNLKNISNAPTVLHFGSKITQGVVIQHFGDSFEVQELESYDSETVANASNEFYKDSQYTRGTGAFGSTGTK